MKRKTIFIALFSAFVACSFVACSNDNDALDINVGTRSVGLSSYMTRDELQARLNEIGEKYGTRVVFEDAVNLDSITEDVFVDFEECFLELKKSPSKTMNKKAFLSNANDNISSFMDDSFVDNILPMAAPPAGETYSNSFDLIIHGIRPALTLYAIVTWYSDSSRGLTGVNVDVQMGDAADYILVTSFKQIGGTNSHPYFEYSGDLYTYAGGKVGSFTDYYNGYNSTIYWD